MSHQPAAVVVRNTRVLSESVRAAADARRKYTPLTVKGISRGNLVLITADKFAKLDVDPSYQRGETAMVAEIVAALQAGGEVLDPVTICKRPWAKDKDALWVVDGHQRVCAFQQLGRSFQAMVHQSESLEAEKQFFLALNSRNAVGTDVIVKSWTGPSGQMIVAANTSPGHPLYERVNFQQGNNKSRIGAGIIARAALVAATGIWSAGTIQKILSRLDIALGPPAKKAMAERYLRLLGEVCPSGSMPLMVSLLLALIANERWKDGQPYPDAKAIMKLRKVNWRQEVPDLTNKFRPIIADIIQKAWKL